MGWMLERIGRLIAGYLDKSERGFEPFVPPDPGALCRTIRPGDVLLVEGNSRISGAIKYLTQSTWSHAALFVGPIEIKGNGSEPNNLIEALLDRGVYRALWHPTRNITRGSVGRLAYPLTIAVAFANSLSPASVCSTT